MNSLRRAILERAYAKMHEELEQRKQRTPDEQFTLATMVGLMSYFTIDIMWQFKELQIKK